MAKFHVNKNGVPSLCKANKTKCPLGEENHFNSFESAQKFANESLSKNFGLLPEIKTEEFPDKWKEKFLNYDNFDEFIKNCAGDIVKEKLFEGKDIKEKTLKKWKDLHYERSSQEVEQMTKENAILTISENVSSSALKGWFREYDSDYKPLIEQSVITSPAVRSAAMSIAYENYKNTFNEEIGFEEFLEKEVTLYRGGNFDFVKNDVFVSFTFDKEIAKKFTSNEKSEIKSMKIKIKETLGSLQTTGESEVLVKRESIKT